MELKGFQLLSGGITSIIKGICVFLSVASNRRYIKVFKLLVNLSIKAYSAVLPRGLYYYNLSLLKRLSCLNATAFYKVSVEFLLSYHEVLREE